MAAPRPHLACRGGEPGWLAKPPVMGKGFPDPASLVEVVNPGWLDKPFATPPWHRPHLACRGGESGWLAKPPVIQAGSPDPASLAEVVKQVCQLRRRVTIS